MKFSFKKAIAGWVAKTLDIQAWLQGADVDDYDKLKGAELHSPYTQSAWVYIAISVLAENVAQIPFRICKMPLSAERDMARNPRRFGKSFRKRVMAENIVDSGAVVDLFEQPHPYMNRSLFWETVMTWRSLRGEMFILPLDKQDQVVDLAQRGAKIAALLPLEPALFWHMVVGYDLEGWRYTGSPLMSPIPSQILLPSEVIFDRMPNPYLFWRGLSPMTVAKLAASADYAAEMFMKGLMMNNADTGVIVTTDQQASAEQREAIMAALRERKRKAGTPDRPLFLWGGAKLDKPAISSADMQFLENRKMNREEIGAIFKVPQSMMGFTERKQSLGGGAGQEQERLTFVESTLTPHCRRLESALLPVVKTFDPSFSCYFDVDDLPVLQEARRNRLDAATKAFALSVPFNEVNEVYDLGFPELPWGDKGFLPFSLQPADQIGAAPEGGQPGQPGANDTSDSEAPSDDPNMDAFGRMAKLLGKLKAASPVAGPVPAHVCAPNPEYENSIKGSVRLKKSKLSRFWFEQRARVLARLPEVMKEFTLDETKSAWSWQPKSEISRGLDDVWNAASEDAALTKRLRPLLITDLEFGGAQVYQEINLDPQTFHLAPNDAINFLDARANAISGINQTTWDSIRASLQQGLAEGDTMAELEDRVKAVYAGLGDARAETIATTETNTAINTGRHTAMKAAKVPKKGWRTSHLENTRSSHMANEELSDEKGGLPIDETWPNGCDYPGDPAGAPGETINCRCFGYAILDKSGPAKPSLSYEAFISLKAKQPHA